MELNTIFTFAIKRLFRFRGHFFFTTELSALIFSAAVCHPLLACLHFLSNTREVRFSHLYLTMWYTELTCHLRIQAIPLCHKFSSVLNICNFFWLPQMWVTTKKTPLSVDHKAINSTKPWWVFQHETLSSHFKYEGTTGHFIMHHFITHYPMVVYAQAEYRSYNLAQIPP